MRLMVIVKGSKESEAGVLPSQEILAAMGKFNEQLVKAGVMLAGEGLHPSSNGSSFQVDPRVTGPYPLSPLPEMIGKFEVMELLGRGAFGMVYKARDPELERTVALKVPRTGYFNTQEEEQRFLREARSTAQLNHPSIVQIHEIGHEKHTPYIVSDYVEGLTLADVLTAGRPGFRESAELVAQIADALEYAHQ